MISNDDFDGKATYLNCFYLHINFEQKYPKPAIMPYSGMNPKIFGHEFPGMYLERPIKKSLSYERDNY